MGTWWEEGGLQERGALRLAVPCRRRSAGRVSTGRGGGGSLSMKELGPPGVAHLSRLPPPSVLPFAGVRTRLKGRFWALRKAADPHPSIS